MTKPSLAIMATLAVGTIAARSFDTTVEVDAP